jgi:sulfur-oxidizing protein SoxY
MMTLPTRRIILQGMAGATAVVAHGLSASSVWAETDAMEKAMRAFTRGAEPKLGQIKLDIAPLVENGNSVAAGVEVESPMTAASYVKRIAIFSEKNPQPEVAVFHLSPRNGEAKVATRIRLATTQNMAAIAEMNDGSFRMDRIEVIVTIAACTEE